MKTFSKLSLSVLTCAFACAAGAQLINVDFKNGVLPVMSGAAYLGSSGDYWNGFIATPGASSFVGLTDSNFNATGVSISYYSTDGGQLSGVADIQPNPFLTADYLQSSSGQSLGFTLNGLTPNGKYDLALYVAADSSVAGDRSVLIGANPNLFQASGDPDSNYLNGEDVAFLNCIADSNGSLNVIEGDGQSNTTGQVVLGGFQIQAVPEPSTVALLGLSFLGFLRRKSK